MNVKNAFLYGEIYMYLPLEIFGTTNGDVCQLCHCSLYGLK